MSNDYSAWVYCGNCNSNHFQGGEHGISIEATPCTKCGVLKLMPSAKDPKDFGYRKLDYIGWVAW